LAAASLGVPSPLPSIQTSGLEPEMPRRSCNDVEYIANLNRRATEAQQTMRRRKIEACMKNQPRCINELWQKLLDFGFDEEKMMSPETPTVQSFTAAAVETRKKRKEEEMEEAAANAKEQDDMGGETSDDEETFGVALAEDPIPPKAMFMGDLSMSLLRDKLVSQIEPRVLSSANIRALKDTASKNHSAMLQYLEYLTGTRSDHPLRGKHWRCFNRMVLKLRKRAARRGDRVMSLSLPPVWELDGLHCIKYCQVEPPKVTVQQRFTKEAVVFSGSDLPPFKSADDLYLSSNYSEVLVALCSRIAPDKTMYLAGHFKLQELPERAGLSSTALFEISGCPRYLRPGSAASSSSSGAHAASPGKSAVRRATGDSSPPASGGVPLKMEPKVVDGVAAVAATAPSSSAAAAPQDTSVKQEVKAEDKDLPTTASIKPGAGGHFDETSFVPPPPPPPPAPASVDVGVKHE